MIEAHRLTRAALLLTAALAAAPLAAQDTAPAATQVVPPPVVPTAAPTASAPTASAPSSTVRGADPQSSTPVNPAAAAQAEEEAAEQRSAARPAPSRPAAARVARAVPVAARRAPAPVATPTAAATPSAVTTPVPQPTAATPTAAAAPVADTPTPVADNATTTTTTTETTSGNALYYVLGALALVVLALGAFALLRRRRADEAVVYEEPAYVEPAPAPRPAAEPAPLREIRADAPAAAPLAAAAATDVIPGTPEDASVVHADAADVDALTAAAPAEGPARPWLELAMRPVRAGADGDQARVDIELTIGNAGSLPAEEVRVATFMLPAENAADMERLIAEHAATAEAVAPLSIAAGDGTRIDATLTLPHDSAAGRIQPVVVCDVRYRLPDGGEGRTSASFLVGVADAGELGSLDAHGLREDVDARLFGDPVRS